MKSIRFYLLVTLLSAFVAAPLAAADRPNILWLTSEDHGPHMGCYGDKLARTPNVDALAAKGMMFQRAWSVAPVCAPARTAIITGLYPSSSGGLHMRSMVSLPEEFKLYPEYLRGAGYYCTNNSKEDYNVRKPKKLWDESSAKAHWKNRAAGQPFFAVFNSTKSHESQIRTRPHKQITDPKLVRVPEYHPDTSEVRQDWAQYYDKVSEADGDAGARLKELSDAGLDADTIVFYYGDHGSGMPRSKRWPCNSGLHVPMVVHFPEKWKHLAPKEYKSGGKSDRLVSFVDLAPTLLSIVGVKPPEWMQGHAFAGEFQTEPPKYIFGERGRMDERMDLVRSVTDGRYVYLRNYMPHVSQAQHVDYQFATPTTRVWRKMFDEKRTDDAQSIFWRVPKAPEELYDLQNDPDEVRNLASAANSREILERFRNMLRQHLVSIRDVCFLPESELHTRATGISPYELGHDQTKYPLDRIILAADRASNLSPEATANLWALLTIDSDPAVRYWAALGLLMRGKEAIVSSEAKLIAALKDESPEVRVVSAQCLGQYGSEKSRAAALETLGELASPKENGVLIAMPALAAIESLGERANSLHPLVKELDPNGRTSDARYNSYVPRLIQNITGKVEKPTR